MDKRVRSPNYPALSLPEAVERTAMIYKVQHSHGAPRDVVAKSMGYNGLNGASATAISALIKYGLLEGRGDEIKVSERALRILHPQSQDEKAEAIREAAKEPVLFRELGEKFPGRLPAEEVLRNYLIRSGFSPSAVSSVVLAYRETSEFADREGGAYDSGQSPPSLESVSMSAPVLLPQNPTGFSNKFVPNQGDERALVQYQFEGGGSLRIVVQGNLDTEEALLMAETLITLKRNEIKARNAKKPTGGEGGGNEDEHNA